ncbi:MAG: phenylalanyl-tRNA synthetase beta chain [Parcubacteria bacterium C7867-006]|nr:MAG: phenylalanyl-tRNA synthetase beta chain [Parcubacteria bacterium C7867-006]
MKVSYKWLQEYIENELPPVERVVEALTMHSFEIEGVEDFGDDKILDVKVLPNRTHDCLSHYGIASEIASVCDLKRKPLLSKQDFPKTEDIKLSINTKLCVRAVMILIKDVEVDESPEWLKEKLKVYGNKSINNIVDITNYLTFAFGQPMHAFDADKIAKNKKDQYEIIIRDAKKGEKITLLDGKEYTLDSTMMVISDTEKPLDVAGVMGGKDSGVSSETKNIILSLSHFDPVSIRKTAKALGIRTDASQRFENSISPSLIDRSLPYALELIDDLVGGIVVGGTDIYLKEQKETVIFITPEKISDILGVDISAEEIVKTLDRQNIKSEIKGGDILVTSPLERLDLEIPENIAEEVGRIYGYEKVLPKELGPGLKVSVNIEDYTSNLIRLSLLKQGFSEIYTYSFTNKGLVELENPIAGDKSFLRQDLISGMEDSLEHNFKYADLLGIKEVKLFEIGKVFGGKGEKLHLCIGVKFPKNKKTPSVDEELAKTIQNLENDLGISVGDVSIMSGVVEFDIDRIVKEIKIGDTNYEEASSVLGKDVSYKTISPYPFAVRDVAVFVPNTVSEEAVTQIIKDKLTDIVVRFSLFDKFAKPEKTSYAFRLVFQSKEKTLTDDEINAVMNPIYETLKAQEGFEIR